MQVGLLLAYCFRELRLKKNSQNFVSKYTHVLNCRLNGLIQKILDGSTSSCVMVV